MAQTLMARFHGCFEHVLESLEKNPIAADLGSFRVFFFHVENGILCVLIRIASMRRF